MKRFAIIGAAGYVAKKHVTAIHQIGGELVAALDPHDNVGYLDSYFPDTDFFTEFERFDRHLEKLKRQQQPIDYLVVCSPNYLHDAHCRFGLRLGADVICEKPLALRPYNVQALIDIEQETGKKINNILQLRLHPQLIALKKMVESTPASKHFEIELTYITARGKWYYASWKNELSKSGGISTNIGIHFFDALQWIFGKPIQNQLHQRDFDREAGQIVFGNASVNWFLSIQRETLPLQITSAKKSSYRLLNVDGQPWEFSEGFTDLHLKSYQEIISGNGFSSKQAIEAINIVYQLRSQTPKRSQNMHPYATLPLSNHPFQSKES